MKLQSVIFATGNKNKLDEARHILGINIEGTVLEIDEIQSLDPVKVATLKACDYYEKLRKPIFIEDVSLAFDALNGLPGTYINDFLKALDNTGLIKLLRRVKDRKATVLTTLVYKFQTVGEQIFQGEMQGSIATVPRGENGFGWDKIFIPDGATKTLAEMTLEEKNKFSMRAKALHIFAEWLRAA